IYPKPPPTTIPSAIRAKLESAGVRNVTSVAMSIAAPAQTIPLRAVSGWLILCRPMMKMMIVAIYTGSITRERSSILGLLSGSLPAGIEHLQDPLGDDVSSGYVRSTQDNCDKP